MRSRILAALTAILGGALAAPAAPPVNVGRVAQDVAIFQHAPTGEARAAVACAFSDSIAIVEASGTALTPLATLSFGQYPGTDNDLPRRIAVRDVNRDGTDDLIVVSSGPAAPAFGGCIQVFEQLPSGAFFAQAPQPVGTGVMEPTNLAVRSLGSRLETVVAVGYSNASRVDVLRLLAAGSFEVRAAAMLPHPSAAVLFADFDGDGREELFAAGTRSFTVLRDITGSGNYTPAYSGSFATLGTATAATAFDDDADGRIDIALATSAGELVLLRNPGAGGLSEPPMVRTHLSWSASEFTDLQTFDFTGDRTPDLVVADRAANRTLVVPGPFPASMPSGDTLTTVNRPRRIAPLDANRSGSLDLLAAGEEEAAANLSLSTNNYIPEARITLRPLGTLEVGAAIPRSYRFVTVAAVPRGNAIAAIDGTRNILVRMDFAGSVIQEIPLTPLGIPAVAGIWADDGAFKYLITEPGARTVKTVRSSGVTDTITVALPSGDRVGLAGVAKGHLEDAPGNIERPRVWVLAPQQRRLYGVDDDTGAILESYQLPLPFTALAVDEDHELAYLGIATQSTIYRMPLVFGQPSPPVRPLPFGSALPAFREQGIAALSYGSSPDTLYALTTDRALISLGEEPDFPPFPRGDQHRDHGGPPDSAATVVARLRRGWAISSVTADPDTGAVWVLDSDGPGSAIAINPSSGAIIRSFPLSAACDEIPDFAPTHIAWDAVASELLVTDAEGRHFARYSSTGMLLGEFSWDDEPAGDLVVPPISGFSVDPATGEIAVRTRRGILRAQRSGHSPEFETLRAGSTSGLAIDSLGGWWEAWPDAARIDATSPAGTVRSGWLAENAANVVSGFTLRPWDGAVIIAERDTGILRIIEPLLDPSATTGNWAAYE